MSGSQIRWQNTIPLVVVLVLVALLGWAVTAMIPDKSGEKAYDPTYMPSALIDHPVPNFSLPALHDEQQLLSPGIFTGEVTLLNVWGTWCISCRVEHPYLNKLSQQGVRIVGLNYKDQTPAAREWLQRLGNPYELNIVDKNGRMGVNLGVSGAPETYLVDSTGIIRYKHTGVIDDRVWKNTLESRYRALLPEPADTTSTVTSSMQ